jgi:sugar phosphate isomerase/epimerase
MASRRSFLKSAGIGACALPVLGVSPARALAAGKAVTTPVCIFSKHLQWLDFEEMGAFVKALGFDGIDLTVRRGGHVPPGQVVDLLPKAIKAIRRGGSSVPMMATNINDPEDPLTEQILEVASGEGIKYYRMQYFKYRRERDIVSELSVFRDKMKKLAELNEKYGIHGAYQNHSGNYVGASIWDIWYMLQELDPAYSGIQFDIRHAVVEGGLSWKIDMQLVGDYIRCSALKDFYWEKRPDGRWRVKNVPLGEGMVDYDAYFEAYQKLGHSGPASLHVEYDYFNGMEKTLSKAEKLSISRDVLGKDLKFLRQYLK